MQLFPILEADRVDDDMRVEVVGIIVCGDDTFVVGEQPFGKLTGNFISLPRRNVLLIRERMDVMKEIDAICFLEGLLGRHHLKVAGVGSTIMSCFNTDAIERHLFGLKNIRKSAEHPAASGVLYLDSCERRHHFFTSPVRSRSAAAISPKASLTSYNLTA